MFPISPVPPHLNRNPSKSSTSSSYNLFFQNPVLQSFSLGVHFMTEIISSVWSVMKEATQVAQTHLIFYQTRALTAFHLTLFKIAVGAVVIPVKIKAKLQFISAIEGHYPLVKK